MPEAWFSLATFQVEWWLEPGHHPFHPRLLAQHKYLEYRLHRPRETSISPIPLLHPTTFLFYPEESEVSEAEVANKESELATEAYFNSFRAFERSLCFSLLLILVSMRHW